MALRTVDPPQMEDGEIEMSPADSLRGTNNSSTGHNRHRNKNQRDNQHQHQHQHQHQPDIIRQQQDQHQHQQRHKNHTIYNNHNHRRDDEGRKNHNHDNYRNERQSRQQHRGRQQHRQHRNRNLQQRHSQQNSPYQRPQDRAAPSTPHSALDSNSSNNSHHRLSAQSRSNTPGSFRRSSSSSRSRSASQGRAGVKDLTRSGPLVPNLDSHKKEEAPPSSLQNRWVPKNKKDPAVEPIRIVSNNKPSLREATEAQISVEQQQQQIPQQPTSTTKGGTDKVIDAATESPLGEREQQTAPVPTSVKEISKDKKESKSDLQRPPVLNLQGAGTTIGNIGTPEYDQPITKRKIIDNDAAVTTTTPTSKSNSKPLPPKRKVIDNGGAVTTTTPTSNSKLLPPKRKVIDNGGAVTTTTPTSNSKLLPLKRKVIDNGGAVTTTTSTSYSKPLPPKRKAIDNGGAITTTTPTSNSKPLPPKREGIDNSGAVTTATPASNSKPLPPKRKVINNAGAVTATTLTSSSKPLPPKRKVISNAGAITTTASKPPPPPKRKVDDAISGWLTKPKKQKKVTQLPSKKKQEQTIVQEQQIPTKQRNPAPPIKKKDRDRTQDVLLKKRKRPEQPPKKHKMLAESLETATAEAPKNHKKKKIKHYKAAAAVAADGETRLVMVTTPPVALSHDERISLTTKLFSPSVVSDDVPTESSFLSNSSSQMLMTSGSIVSLVDVAATTDEWSSLSPSRVVSVPVIVAAVSLDNASSSANKETPLEMKVIKEVLVEVQKATCSVGAAAMYDSSSESETDEEEVLQWGEKMFGVTPPGLLKLRQERQRVLEAEEEAEVSEEGSSDEEREWDDRHVVEKLLSTSFRQKPFTKPKRKQQELKPMSTSVKSKICQLDFDDKRKKFEKKRLKGVEDNKRKKEEAKPLTAAQIREILGEDASAAPSLHWVRRSCRQPCKDALSAPGVRSLLDKLRGNDSDMVVLKMKKYVSDPDAPQVVIDAALDALEENTNCEALYIQNFNKGMHDEQVLHLLKILQQPACKIWCLNIGETYHVKSKTWRRFTRGLKRTKVTNMYASEHTIDGELKHRILNTIRTNRAKHSMHNNPENLDVIVQCTHCWWNPMNAKSLRPYLRKKGYEHMLLDREAQGLRGSTSGAAGADSAVSAEGVEYKDSRLA